MAVRRRSEGALASTRSCAPNPAGARRASLGRPLLKRTLALTLGEVRTAAADGAEPPSADEILARALPASLAHRRRASRPVINATGVMLHTNLGRAPLARGRGACRGPGGRAPTPTSRSTARPAARGKRGGRAEELLIALTGAEDALVVNNCAAALLLALASLAKGKEVLVSRGELIEIGGEFRIPDIMACLGRQARRGRHHEPDAHRPTTAPRPRRAHRRDPEGASVELPGGRLHGRGEREGPRPRSPTKRGVPVPVRRRLGAAATRRTGFRRDEPSVRRRARRRRRTSSRARGDKLLGGPQAGMRRRPGRPHRPAPPTPDRARGAGRQAAGRRARGGPRDVRDRPRRRASRSIGCCARRPTSVHHRAQALCEAIGGDLEGAHVARCRVGGRRRVDAGREPPLLGGPRDGRPTRRRSRRGCAPARRRCSAGSRTTPCCSTCARSRPTEEPTPRPRASCTRWRATTSHED